jgi:hypothetical protein
VQAPSQQLPSFRSAAARHRNTNYVVNFTQGLPIQIPLNRQGYLAELRIKFEGTVTTSAGGTVNDPYASTNLFPSISIRSPQGDYLVSLSARSLFNFQHRFQPSIIEAAPHAVGQIGLVRPDAFQFDPTIAAAQTVDIAYQIPLSLNLGQNFETGLVLAQIANNDFYLQLNCANPSDLLGGGGTAVISSITGTVYIEQIWFELVDPQQVQAPDIHSIARLRDSIFSPLVIGDNYVSYQLGPVMMDAMHLIIDGATPQGDTSNGVNFNYLKLLANRQIEIENRRGRDVFRDNFYELQKQLPHGVFLLNFMDDYSEVNVTRARDFINSNLAAQLDTVINVAAGTVVAGSSVTSIYRELITLGA